MHYMDATGWSSNAGTFSGVAELQGRYRLGRPETARLLTREQEQLYASRVRGGDMTARNLMIQHNLRLVMKLAGHYRGCGLSHEDLVGEGTFGLIRAVEKFRPELGFRFSTYATQWIRQAMERAIVSQKSIVRIPYRLDAEHRQLSKKQAVQKAIEAGVGDQASPVEKIPDGIKKTKKQKATPCLPKVSSLHDGQGKGGLLELLADPVAPLGDRLQHEQLCERLQQWLLALPLMQQQVLCLTYGLRGFTASSQQTVADRLGISRRKVAALHESALQGLKCELERNKLCRQTVLSGW